MKPRSSRSVHGLWIPVFIKTTEPDILGKQRWKRVSCREKNPDFAKLRLVYKVQNAWELRSQSKRTSFLCSTRPIGQALLETHSSKIRETRLRRADKRKLFALHRLKSWRSAFFTNLLWHHKFLTVTVQAKGNIGTNHFADHFTRLKSFWMLTYS